MATREPTLTKAQHAAFEEWFLSYFPETGPTETDLNGKWWALEGFEYGLLHDRRKTRRLDIDNTPPVYQRPKAWFSRKESTQGTPRIAIRQYREMEYLTLVQVEEYLEAVKLACADARKYEAEQPTIRLISVNELRKGDTFETGSGQVYEVAVAPTILPSLPWNQRVRIVPKYKKKGPGALHAPMGQPVRLLHRPEKIDA